MQSGVIWGATSDVTDEAVQANVVAVGYKMSTRPRGAVKLDDGQMRQLATPKGTRQSAPEDLQGGRAKILEGRFSGGPISWRADFPGETMRGGGGGC